VTRELSSSLGRSPNESEVAEQMGVGMDRWRRMQIELRTIGVVSATPTGESDRERTMDFPAADDSQPDRMCERRQLQTTLARAIGSLPERYQKVVSLLLHQRADDEADRPDAGRE